MEKEISNGAMLGIVLIALAAIIGLGFGVFSIAKGTANEGVTNVQEGLGSVSASAFTDYDQKVVTGTQVTSCLQNFEGKPYSILIATQAVKDNTATGGGTITSGAAGLDKYKGSKPPVAVAYNEPSFNTTMKVLKSSDTGSTGTCDLTFIQYNAKLGDANTSKPDVAQIGFDSNCWRTVKGFQTVSGKIAMNSITGNLSKSGMVEYIPSTARFQSYLIKDLSGTNMGIAFEQINSK